VLDLYRNRASAKVANCLDWRTDTVEVEGRTLPSLFQNPPAEGMGDATFRIELLPEPDGKRLVLRFLAAFTGPTANGARLSVLIDGAEAWSSTQTTQPAEPADVALSTWAGRTVTLTLRVDALGDASNDWVDWVRPQVLLVDGD